jgi:chromosome segregation ATPase
MSLEEFKVSNELVSKVWQRLHKGESRTSIYVSLPTVRAVLEVLEDVGSDKEEVQTTLPPTNQELKAWLKTQQDWIGQLFGLVNSTQDAFSEELEKAKKEINRLNLVTVHQEDLEQAKKDLEGNIRSVDRKHEGAQVTAQRAEALANRVQSARDSTGREVSDIRSDIQRLEAQNKRLQEENAGLEMRLNKLETHRKYDL